MKILCASDGSDDGYQGLAVIAQIIDRHEIEEIKIVMVTWPEREAQLWVKANDLRFIEHDLHQAMQVTVERELKRFQSVLQKHAKTITATSDTGDPIVRVLEDAALMNADLIFLVITSDPRASAVRSASTKIIAKSPVPVVVVYGPGKYISNGSESERSST